MFKSTDLDELVDVHEVGGRVGEARRQPGAVGQRAQAAQLVLAQRALRQHRVDGDARLLAVCNHPSVITDPDPCNDRPLVVCDPGLQFKVVASNPVAPQWFNSDSDRSL